MMKVVLRKTKNILYKHLSYLFYKKVQQMQVNLLL